jgi:sec-independent protein translocase protein TatC
MFVIAAIVTPPDVISQITLGLPLYLLYELGILLCKLIPRRERSSG